MSLSNHTPGPWKYNGKTDVYDSGGYTICELYKGYDLVAECQANANLIAAAPQLIEALEMLLDHEPNEWCECHAAERASWKYAKETLAKAKGEAES